MLYPNVCNCFIRRQLFTIVKYFFKWLHNKIRKSVPEVPAVPGSVNAAASYAQAVQAVFAPGGALALAMPDFESRRGQACAAGPEAGAEAWSDEWHERIEFAA